MKALYTLIIKTETEDRSTTSKFINYKRIRFHLNKKNHSLKATLIDTSNNKRIVEYTNVVSVEKIKS